MKALMMTMLICFVVGCSATKKETPQDGAAAISDLLLKRDYSTLFQERYSEWHKVKTEGIEPGVAIEKLSAMFEKQHDMQVSVFKQLASAEFTLSKSEMPQMTETGDVAAATVSVNGKDITYRLYRMKNGLWGFHL